MYSIYVIPIAAFLVLLLFLLALNSNIKDSSKRNYDYDKRNQDFEEFREEYRKQKILEREQEKQKQEERAKDLGKRGEEEIIDLLGGTVWGEQYLINNLILQDGNKWTTQIDHVFINSNGVYVIETKNLSGRIYGNEKQRQWTQVLNYGEEKHKIYNPVMQNELHIHKLWKATQTKLPIKSMVVFVQDNTEYITAPNVYSTYDMIKEISTPSKNKISVEQMEQFYNQLLALQANQITDEEHIDNIQKAQNDKGLGTCPYCGNKLIERNSEYGTFYGCNGFPNCTYKTNRL